MQHAELQDVLIPAARALGVGVIASSPLRCGALAGRWQTWGGVPQQVRHRRLAHVSEERFQQVWLILQRLRKQLPLSYSDESKAVLLRELPLP